MGIFVEAALLVFAGIWCAQIFRRLPQDVAEFKGANDGAARTSLIIVWLLTPGVIAWLLSRVGGIVSAIIS